jgi:TM2 domain-containing membrane protein YozV
VGASRRQPAAPAPVVTRALAAQARLPLKSPLAAGALSWLWPGLGQMYVGMIGRGFAQAIFIPLACTVVMYLAFIAAAFGELGAARMLVLAVFLVWWAVAYDAADQAQRVNAARTNARAAVRAARGRDLAPFAPFAPVNVLWTRRRCARGPTLPVCRVVTENRYEI